MRQPVVALACVAVGSGSPSAPIYLVHGHLGPLGWRGRLVAIERPDARTPRAALLELLRGPTAAERGRGVRSALPRGTRLVAVGVAGLPAWRERVEEGERTIEEAGGKLIGVYVTLGRYDVVEIFEAPDDEVAIEILMKLQRHGAEQTETLRAFTRQEAEDIVKRL